MPNLVWQLEDCNRMRTAQILVVISLLRSLAIYLLGVVFELLFLKKFDFKLPWFIS